MKTSTLTATLAVIGGFVILTAANLKLKSEYDKGKLQSAYVERKIPPFRYIREMLDSNSTKGGRFEVEAGPGLGSSISTYYTEKASLLFTVSNDTLYIKNDPADKDMYVMMRPVRIRTPHLDLIDISQQSYNLNATGMDSLSVVAAGKSSINILLPKLNILSVDASGHAVISVSSPEAIHKASIYLDNESSFDAKDLVVLQKDLRLGNNASIHLSGRSMKDFGVRSTQQQ